ncbi:hypothetical protein ACFVU3_11320 [Streptomyces sp. NPDC058052]|uniref:hypothetical protein n=1 Tax=Streptomyces sp. NPDC058052 TaxID=3346316 RepID=UPI0036E71BAB
MFACAGCGTELTAPVSRVALPVHTYHGGWEELHPPLMEPSTYAVEPAPGGSPEAGGEPAARQDVDAPDPSGSIGPRVRVVIAPGDSRSMSLILDRCEGYCRGVNGHDGPNLACDGCGRPVATRVDDCGAWQTVWLARGAFVRRPSGLPAGPPPGWDDLARAEHRVPPVEPDGTWSRRWEAAVGVALAHLVVASGGRPVTLPAGPAADLLGHAVGQYLPAGPDPRSTALAGPAVPLPRPRPDILLVPRHPLTGAPWRPPGDEGPVVPVDSGVWAYLVHPGETSPMPVTGVLPKGVLRDDYPVPPHPSCLLTAHHHAFEHTLDELPDVPGLRRDAYRRTYG